ncbi:ABC transporter six-transmembrane domain-containing protein [Amphritea japonica]|uniref:ABC transporter permease protein n=1 Tax=Amphritea japonica ATCC BAA-1530 TaxID=1278309 RepID=A0A7R6SSK9_9GAMM|nr:ABC transporter six-transmembrane domain-containing protein [Amphritea japonica]BBB25697.1 ABC transporter permease protein [Amphritea japonica ATCC BAA-1530]
MLTGTLNLKLLLTQYSQGVAVTWGLVLLENIMLALIPLLIGFSIDNLLEGVADQLILLAIIMVLLTGVAVLRRVYDTRMYGAMKVALGLELDQRNLYLNVSTRSARLDMSRELVSFLEDDVPELITGVTQIIISLAILSSFGLGLAMNAAGMTLTMLLLYTFFHRSFLRLNQALNNQTERQVALLTRGFHTSLNRHLSLLLRWEVKLSDREAILYGLIFLLVTGFIVSNLWLATAIPDISAGTIFTIITYSWEFVQAALVLPMTLQGLTRLHEITERINSKKVV